MVRIYSNDKNAIWCDSRFGPCFGDGDSTRGDIDIYSDSNLNKKSSTGLYAYKRANHQADTEETKFILQSTRVTTTRTITNIEL